MVALKSKRNDNAGSAIHICGRENHFEHFHAPFLQKSLRRD
jgi:hypothetical protein